MRNGDKILVKAICSTRYIYSEEKHRSYKIIDRYEYEEPIIGLFLGYSFRATGVYKPSSGGISSGYDSYEPASLEISERHRVAVFVVIDDRIDYTKPLVALVKDVEVTN